MKNASGFTLIELIGAIVILTIGAPARLPDTTSNLSAHADRRASDILSTDTTGTIGSAAWRAAAGP